VIVRIVDVSESDGLELGVLHAPTLPPAGCGLLLYNSYSDRTSFAIWRVGERTTTQLLMCDRYERTRSWFCVVPLEGGKTLLRFGSAVAASGDQQTGSRTRDNRFRLLLKFHVVYSQVLLNAARRGVMRLTVSV
jgi:hypothetical protein